MCWHCERPTLRATEGKVTPLFNRFVNLIWSLITWGLLVVVVSTLLIGVYVYNRADEEMEEHLEIESVTGTVAGEAAVLEQNVDFNWRTLADERYYLDTGGLDNIEIS